MTLSVLSRGAMAAILVASACTFASADTLTTTTTVTSTTPATITYMEPSNDDRYNSSYFNYYDGYGSMADMNKGCVNVRGTDGNWHAVSLKDNRTMVRLSDDSSMDPKLDMARGFERGMPDTSTSTWDPHMLVIPTGQHVTFYSDGGAHTIQPMDGHSMTQSVIITPGICYNYTFTQPGLYRFEDSFGGGPTASNIHGLVIRVTGDPVAFNDCTFVDAIVPVETAQVNTTVITTTPNP